MTERKSTEIKIRVTPSEKARWQADSEREGVSLSELVCRRMNFSAALAIQKASIADDVCGADCTCGCAEGLTIQTPPERRTEPCSHSKPPYAFCPTCDR